MYTLGRPATTFDTSDLVTLETWVANAVYKEPRPKDTTLLRKAFLETQNDRCAICACKVIEMRPTKGMTDEVACLDHCHVTGAIRGVLCSACNKGLGFFRDSVDRLQAAVSYLTRGLQCGTTVATLPGEPIEKDGSNGR